MEKLGQDPAYPTMVEERTSEYSELPNTLQYQYGGMSKRFYAACAAMQGLLANRSMINNGDDQSIHWCVLTSYKLADEILKQE